MYSNKLESASKEGLKYETIFDFFKVLGEFQNNPYFKIFLIYFDQLQLV